MGILFEPFFYIISLLVDIYFNIVVLEVVLNWLLYFKVIKVDNQLTSKVMSILTMLTQPVYAKIREKVPPFSGFDLSPFILLLALLFVGRLADKILELQDGKAIRKIFERSPVYVKYNVLIRKTCRFCNSTEIIPLEVCKRKPYVSTRVRIYYSDGRNTQINTGIISII